MKVVTAKMSDHSPVLGWLQIRKPPGKEGSTTVAFMSLSDISYNEALE